MSEAQNSVERGGTVMEAGRDLDKVIHTDVMGQCAHPFDQWVKTVCQGDSDISCGVCGTSRMTIPRYSTDIAAAWQVVEEMERRGWSCCIATNACSNGKQNGAKFYEGFRSLGYSIFDGEAHDGHSAVAETVPLAICLAALSSTPKEPNP